ncbi:hypothetical protein RHMOL_Rhmol02G0197800 [Rhododendron molle]|uniref:Uncharacterized protein n=1 Tax=Rhododendron molle TaxID=49168 RepID=A0ACC0PV45_RHOML|nr:hypothetical protein RHMOL_Rhmol02G0197800 [Rhododendron molle]
MSSMGSSSTGSATSKPVDHDENAPLWDYVTKLIKRGEGGNNTKFKCNVCNLDFQGSYMRVKTHLLLTKDKGIRLCSVVKERSELLVEIRKAHEEAENRKIMAQPKNVPLPPPSTTIGGVGGFRLEGYDPEPKKRKAVGNSPLKKAMNMGAQETLHSHIARMFYSAGLSFHLARNPYLIATFQFAAENNILGYVPPGFNLLRTTLLQKERAHIALLLEPIKKTWNEKGLSIVADGWSDAQRRPLINFMGASDGGAVFMRAINCEGETKDKTFIAKLLGEAINEVGPQNVVQVITDNAPICSAAGSIIEGIYPKIFWTPCVVHTFNLALKNMCGPKETGVAGFAFDECLWIKHVIDDVMFVKNFIMNHSMRLVIFNEFVSLKLLSIADTHFASSIIMLKRFKLISCGLQAMVISHRWSSYREDDGVKAASVKEKVLSDIWYYSTTWLVGNRVAPHLDDEISAMRMKCFKRFFPAQDERTVVDIEYAKFSGCLDGFGDSNSKVDRGVLEPRFWWLVHGASAPILQSLALKLLSQPCSSCCERNWSTYSFIHSMRRNKMTPQQCEDLVSMHYNIRLLPRRQPLYTK